MKTLWRLLKRLWQLIKDKARKEKEVNQDTEETNKDAEELTAEEGEKKKEKEKKERERKEKEEKDKIDLRRFLKKAMPEIVIAVILIVVINQISSYALGRFITWWDFGHWVETRVAEILRDPLTNHWVLTLILFASHYLIGKNKLKSDEQGGRALFGKPWLPAYSGLLWPPLLWPFESLTILTKERVELNVKSGKVITRAGTYRKFGPVKYLDKKTGKVEKKIVQLLEERVEAEEIEVDSVIYVSVGGGPNLLQAIQYLPRNVRKAGKDLEKFKVALLDFLQQAMLSVVRTKAAERMWPENNDDRAVLAKDIEKALKDDVTFDQSGLGANLTAGITEVKLPPKLLEALMAVEIAAREKAKTILEAEAARKATEEAADAQKYADVRDAEALFKELVNEMKGLGLEEKERGGFSEKDIDKFMAHRERLRLAGAIGKAETRFYNGNLEGVDGAVGSMLNFLRGGKVPTIIKG